MGNYYLLVCNGIDLILRQSKSIYGNLAYYGSLFPSVTVKIRKIWSFQVLGKLIKSSLKLAK